MKKIKLGFILYFLLNIIVYSEEIVLWNYWSLKLTEHLKNAISNFEKKTGHTVKVKDIPMGAMNTRFIIVVGEGRGEGPDVVLGLADWIGQFNEKEELLEPINQYFSEDKLMDFFPHTIEGCILNEKLYGLPINYNVLGLVYNKDLIKKVPETMDELIKTAKKITDEEEGIYGLVYNNTNYYYHWPFVQGFGISPLDKNKMPTFNTKEQIRAAEFIRDLQDKYKIIPREINEEMAIAMFHDGLAGFLITGPWEIMNLIESGINFGVTMIPFIEETKRWPTPIVGPDVLMISKKSKNKKISIELIEYLVSEEAQMEIYKSKQSLPVLKSVMEKDELKQSTWYEYVQGFIKQSNYGVPMPREPELNIGIWSNGAPALHEIITNGQNAKEVMEQAQKKGVESIEEYRKSLKKD